MLPVETARDTWVEGCRQQRQRLLKALGRADSGGNWCVEEKEDFTSQSFDHDHQEMILGKTFPVPRLLGLGHPQPA